MPGLGEKLYNKLINELLTTEKKIGNQTYDFKDKDKEKDFQNEITKLQESWNAMALFFEGMANASTGNDSTLFSSAHLFCKDMAGAVGDSPEIEDGKVDIVKEAYENLKNYDDFDKALEVLFRETDKPVFSLNEAEDPDLPKNSSYTQKIEYNQRKYNKLIQEEKGRAIPIGIGEQLIKGIKGLQTYIKEGLAENKIDNDLDNDLNEKIKHVEEVIQQPQKQQQKLESIYLGYLQDSLFKSHRLLGNSTEYGTMLEKAQALYRDWENTNDIGRHRLAEAALSAAQKYITRKQGSNTDKNWTPITKEGKKRFALAKDLLKTVKALLDEELTPRITKDLIDNDEDFIENDPSVEKDKNKFINTNQKNNKNQEKNKIDQESSRQDRITTEAETKLAGYSIFYMGTNVSGEIDDLVAKAVAVNVLKQIGINDPQKPEPKEIFTPTKIDTVAEAVKQTELFTKDRDRLEKMVFKEEDNVTMFTFMEPNDINDIINSNDFINSINKQEIKFGPPEAGPAKITSTQQEQDKNINDNKSIDNKSNGKQL